MKALSIVATALAATTVLAPIAKADVVWQPANGKSCHDVCGMKHMVALSSGKYKTGEPFYVCSANQNGEGWRSGYNLKPSWANVCMVPYGTKEVRASTYQCACE